MDEVMADALGEHLLRYNRHFGENVTLKDLQGKWLWEGVSTDRHDVLDEYLRWVATPFPFIPASHIVYCGDKSILRADYLIDDNPRQLRRFKGEGILYSSPHNAGVTGYKRVNNWLEVEEMFLG